MTAQLSIRVSELLQRNVKREKLITIKPAKFILKGGKTGFNFFV